MSLTTTACREHAVPAAANSAAGFDSLIHEARKRLHSSRRFFSARSHAGVPCQFYGGRRGEPSGSPVLRPVCQPASSVTLFDSGAPDSLDLRSPTMHAQPNTTPEFRDALAGLAETINAVAGQLPATNEAVPDYTSTFFRRLRQSDGGAHDVGGVNWNRPLPAHFGYRLASVCREVHAITGLAELLHADNAAREEGSDSDQLGEYRRNQMFVALVELANNTAHTLGTLGDYLMDEDMKARRAAQGEAA